MNNKVFSFIDLHLHLDGAIDLNIARRLAKINNVSLPNDDELNKLLTVPNECDSLNDFLKCFSLPLSLLQTKESIELATYLILEKLKNEGLEYVELRFAPQLHKELGLTQEEVVDSALKGINKSDLKSNLILCLMRGDSNYKENLETVEVAHKYLVKDNGVVAIDLAGAEALYKTKDYKDLFILARSYNIPFTIHAGEADDYTSVNDAVGYGTKRIGHGIRIKDNNESIKLIKNNFISLEMCPTSNRQTKAIDDMKDYPLLKFLNEGLLVTINTDDPAIESTSLEKEFDYLDELYNLSIDEKKKLVLNSINAAFTTKEMKDELINKFILRFRGN